MKPYYQDDYCTIYHGDCREILSRLEPADHVITDPPYAAQTHSGARATSNGRVVELVDFDPIDVYELRRIFGLCLPRRWLVSFLDYQHATRLESDPPDGMRGMRICIWDKPNPCPQFTGDRPGPTKAPATPYRSNVNEKLNYETSR